jgi:hypothetical protein
MLDLYFLDIYGYRATTYYRCKLGKLMKVKNADDD